MDVEKGEPYVVVGLAPGVRAVRFTQPVLLDSKDDPVFRRLWGRVLEGAGGGDIVILNFKQVRDYNSCFLAGIILAGKALREWGGAFIGVTSVTNSSRSGAWWASDNHSIIFSTM